VERRTSTQRGIFDVFGGVALRQDNEYIFARKRNFFGRGTFSAKIGVLRSKTPFFAQPARRLSAIQSDFRVLEAKPGGF